MLWVMECILWSPSGRGGCVPLSCLAAVAKWGPKHSSGHQVHYLHSLFSLDFWSCSTAIPLFSNYILLVFPWLQRSVTSWLFFPVLFSFSWQTCRRKLGKGYEEIRSCIVTLSVEARCLILVICSDKLKFILITKLFKMDNKVISGRFATCLEPRQQRKGNVPKNLGGQVQNQPLILCLNWMCIFARMITFRE